MKFETPSGIESSHTELGITADGRCLEPHEPQGFTEEYDSTCSTPYVSAPSSPGRAPELSSINGGFFYSAPASPMHFAITSVASMVSSTRPPSPDNSVPLGFEFEFSGRFGSPGSGQTGSMSSADELFLNGRIRPMKLSTHLERPQVLAPLMDLENEDDEENGDVENSKVRGRDLRLRDKSLRRRTRSMSPLRNAGFGLHDQNVCLDKDSGKNAADSKNDDEIEDMCASMSASSSRSSSSGRSSKRWVFLKDFLRSKSEGRSNNKFWSTISFSPAKEKKPGIQHSKEKLSNASNGVSENQRSIKSKPVNGIGKGKGKRRVPPSLHELHYTANRAQSEEMRKKTFLPYKQGLFGCLSFSSKGYGAMNGLARALNPVSSS
ncbi:hypothetical protein like AT3G62630 [Hibiscus trionum]|uniref:Uncharacterized protein n=1 Tax=Hibiscus trionum TaxID=183268 RepID=A0A9W7MBJ5_HIBTR|nr:hypothetical protein like AT3G62630 [Hibiscus trionum]